MDPIDTLDNLLWVIRHPIQALLVASLFVAFVAIVAPNLR